MATETFLCSKCETDFDIDQKHTHPNAQLCDSCNADFVVEEAAQCGCDLCSAEHHCCYCGDEAENHCDRCGDHLCESCAGEKGHRLEDRLLCGGCYEAEEDE